MALSSQIQIEIQNIERRALRLTLLFGAVKALFYSGIVLAVVGKAFPLSQMILAVAGATLLWAFLDYRWVFRPNIVHHKILKKRLGDHYQIEVFEALKNIGLRRMLYDRWFVKRYNQVWDI